VKDLIIGLVLGAVTAYIWTTLEVNKNIVTPYKRTISKHEEEIIYLKNCLIERNNELIQVHQYIIYLKKQYGLPDLFATQ
jgi:hypothetical protein